MKDEQPEPVQQVEGELDNSAPLDAQRELCEPRSNEKLSGQLSAKNFDRPAQETQVVCPKSLIDSLAANGFLLSEKFDVREIPHNQGPLAEWEERNDFMIHYMMERLTGHKTLPPFEEIKIGTLKSQLSSLVGLADNPWLLPFLVVVGEGTYKLITGRRVKSKHDFHFTGKEEMQALPAESVDGVKHELQVPTAIVLDFVTRPMSVYAMAKPKEFVVSQAYVEQICHVGGSQRPGAKEKKAQTRPKTLDF